MTPTLVVGAGGLIGGAVTAALGPTARPAAVRWTSPERDDDLRSAVAALAADPEVRRSGWRIAWCAGRSVVGSEDAPAAAETAAFARLLGAVADLLPGGPRGRIVLTSSAGGLHAGGEPPFDEASVPAPRTAYGAQKLEQERLLAASAAGLGHDAVTVRLGPVYGPGQDPSKPQGLVSALSRAVVTRRPVRIYVPVETRRPYLWVGDAGRILAGLLGAPADAGGALRVRTVPAGPEVSIRQLVGTVGRIARRTPPVLLAPGPEAAAHARDLRLATRHPAETVLPDPTPLTVGVGRLWRAMLSEPTRAR